MRETAVAGAPAVVRALDLLELLARSRCGLTLSELSRKLAIPTSSMHYLIYTLAARGYLQKAPWTRQYLLGVRAFDFASNTLAELHLAEVFAPSIRSLAARLGLGAQIAILKGGEGMVLDRVDNRPRPSATRRGYHFLLHCTAAGKALIAWLPDSELEELFPNRFLGKFTPHTITQFSALKAHLAEVRKKSYSFNDQEYHLDRRAVAVPIFNNAQRVIASLSLDGCSSEIPLPRVPHIAAELLEGAREISRHLAVA